MLGPQNDVIQLAKRNTYCVCDNRADYVRLPPAESIYLYICSTHLRTLMVTMTIKQ